MLDGKTAVVYGAAGPIGAAVVDAFAEQGATVIATGRTAATVQNVVAPLAGRGLTVHATRLDAQVEAEVEAHLDGVVREHGGIDVSFNAIGVAYVLGEPLHEIGVERFVRGIADAMRTNYLTGVGAARRMAERRHGVVLAITASPARRAIAHQGSFSVAGAAIEALCRQIATDYGPQGVRAVCIRSAGSPDSPGVDAAMNKLAEAEGVSRDVSHCRTHPAEAVATAPGSRRPRGARRQRPRLVDDRRGGQRDLRRSQRLSLALTEIVRDDAAVDSAS